MKFLLYLFLFASLNSAAQGYIFSSAEQLQEIDEYINDDKGYIDNLPSAYSLEIYVPPILSQQGSSCVGFASLYYGLSISYNIKYQNTSLIEKYAYSFDPYFIYSILSHPNNNCENGLIMNQAMEALYKIGGKKLFYPEFLTCRSSWNEEEFNNTLKYTLPYKIKEFYRVDVNKENLINDIKGVLSNNTPLVAGVTMIKSLLPYASNNVNGITSNGLWNPKDGEKEIGGHAMCVIGYDDDKFGGSFRLVNSWGSDYADNGFLWVKYSDFKKYAEEVFFVEPNEIDDQTNYQRVSFTDLRYKGHVYEGQILDGYMHGYGIYSFSNNSILVGNFNHGSREGVFYYLDGNDDKIIKQIYYKNNIEIDTQTLGFSSMKEEDELKEAKEYFNILFPNKKVIIVNEGLDLDIFKKID